eukprot:3431397-Amphidinium_carterae.1
MGVRGCSRVFAGVRGCSRVFVGVRGCSRVFAGIRGVSSRVFAVFAGVRGCSRARLLTAWGPPFTIFFPAEGQIEDQRTGAQKCCARAGIFKIK